MACLKAFYVFWLLKKQRGPILLAMYSFETENLVDKNHEHDRILVDYDLIGALKK